MSTNPVLFAFRAKCLQQFLGLFRTFLHQISYVIKVCTTTLKNMKKKMQLFHSIKSTRWIKLSLVGLYLKYWKWKGEKESLSSLKITSIRFLTVFSKSPCELVCVCRWRQQMITCLKSYFRAAKGKVEKYSIGIMSCLGLGLVCLFNFLSRGRQSWANIFSSYSKACISGTNFVRLARILTGVRNWNRWTLVGMDDK